MTKIGKFEKFLQNYGAEILPSTNEYEAVRFKGSKIGVIYTSGKFSNRYAEHAYDCFKRNKHWNGGPISTGRHSSYKRQKKLLIKRDGSDCFLCGKPLGEDITVEHLIALSWGGRNTISNMVLCHEACNAELSNKPISEKVKLAINKRIS